MRLSLPISDAQARTNCPTFPNRRKEEVRCRRPFHRIGPRGCSWGRSSFGASCTGVIGAQDSGNSRPGGGGAGGAGGGGSGGAGGGLDCTAPSPGPSYARRLNRFEYNNTVRDLLGDRSAPATDFPAEERRNGFDNNAIALQISPTLVEQYMNAAEKLAAAALTNMPSLLPCDPLKDGEDACGQSFISSFGAKAFRHPLSAAESARLLTAFDAGRKLTDFKTGIQLVIETALQSPEFLYRVEFGAAPGAGQTVVKPTSFEMASRLSYLLWQSMPDDELRAAAQQDKLTATDAIAAQVDRMMKDPKARAVVAHFNELWFHLDEYDGLEKDIDRFPAFTPDIAPLMAEETHRFLDHVIWDGAGDVGAILTAPYTFLNAKLAGYYGVSGVAGDAFVRVNLDPDAAVRPAHPGRAPLGSRQIEPDLTRAPRQVRARAVLVRRAAASASRYHHQAARAELDALHARTVRRAPRDAACSGCHQLMDPIGLTFENYDGAGKYRTTENGPTHRCLRRDRARAT